MSYTICRAHVEHLDLMLPLFDAYRRFYGRTDREGSRTFLHDRMQNDESVILLALDDASESGAGFIQLYPLFSSVRMNRTWVLNDLYVAEEARRSGIARRLLDAAVSFARSESASYLELATQKSNAAARQLYLSMGWKSDDEFEHFTMELEKPGSR
ncbi:MAG: GNAT family N-acetyltransferase [Rhodothermia bacterium]|nr:GNAT family N-acetyltransferase [Rhodothermia bacterium]